MEQKAFMKNLSSVIFLAVTCLAFKADNKVNIKDFAPSFGKWKGSLTYLDYKTGKPFSMPANVTLTKSETNANQLILAYEYPNEHKADGNDTLTISDGGLQLDNGKIISKQTQANGTIEIITEENGKDGNDHKSAIIKMTYLVGKDHFSIQKDVQFTGETKFIQRDIFSFKR